MTDNGILIDDKILLAFMGIVFLVLQFIQTMVNRKWTREIIDKLSEGTEKTAQYLEGIKTHFDNHHAIQDGELKEIKEKTHIIHDTVIKTDSDGSPLIFVPRSWIDTQKEISEVCSKTASLLESSMKILERIDARQDQRRKDFGD